MGFMFISRLESKVRLLLILFFRRIRVATEEVGTTFPALPKDIICWINLSDRHHYSVLSSSQS